MPQTRQSRLVVLIIAVAMILYMGSYAILSANGRYIEYIGAGADGTKYWYPLWCNNRTPAASGRIKTQSSLLGVFYMPLLLIDHAFIHRNESGIIESGDS